ncbi:hypothetical protein [Thiorhodococcus mannitoliphagus]
MHLLKLLENPPPPRPVLTAARANAAQYAIAIAPYSG